MNKKPGMFETWVDLLMFLAVVLVFIALAAGLAAFAWSLIP
jgi:hypothetical protein